MTLQTSSDLPLFGGKLHWDTSEWSSSDDRVRGGASVSELELVEDGSCVLFTGVLDIDTLGGAGFASQKTKTEDKTWDLRGYEYIRVTIRTDLSDDKNYTFVLKDTLLPPDPKTGREQSTVSYEVDLDIKERDRFHDTKIFYFKLNDLVPNYRGKKKSDAEPLAKEAVRRFSIMMRSHFGAQSGAFRLGISSITAVKKPPITKSVSFRDEADAEVMTSGNSYGTFQPWNWRRGHHQVDARAHAQLTRHERVKQWSKANQDYVVLAGFCISMVFVILLFGLIDGKRPWPHRPPPASPLPSAAPSTSLSPSPSSSPAPSPT